MINKYIGDWKALLDAPDDKALYAMLAEEAIFTSPAVHTPQKGRKLAFAYLSAAKKVLKNDSFKYLNQWVNDTSAILEFELELNGIYINGIDMITWNEAGEITEFKVMIRPLKGLNMVVQEMGNLLTK